MLPIILGGQLHLLSICPKCQEEYKKVKFDKIHRDLMKYLKKAGAKIVEPGEVKFEVIEPEKAE